MITLLLLLLKDEVQVISYASTPADAQLPYHWGTTSESELMLDQRLRLLLAAVNCYGGSPAAMLLLLLQPGGAGSCPTAAAAHLCSSSSSRTQKAAHSRSK
jgi:hypothetical protein